jgi:hypothetical protein
VELVPALAPGLDQARGLENVEVPRDRLPRRAEPVLGRQAGTDLEERGRRDNRDMPADGRTDDATRKATDPKAAGKAAVKGAGKGADKSPTTKESGVSRIASYLAIAAFFFGVGNATDLWDRFFGDESPRAQAAHVQAQARHSLAVQGYFAKVDDVACQANATTQGTPKNVSATWLDRALDSRLRFAAKWPDPLRESALTATERAAIESAIDRFVTGTDFWAALLADAKAGNVSAYNAHVGEYRRAMADYRAVLAPYRTGGCALVWPGLPVWRPS